MELNELLDKALGLGSLTLEEGVQLYHHAPLADLMFVADELRKKQVPHGKVTWQIVSFVTSIVFLVMQKHISPTCLFTERKLKKH